MMFADLTDTDFEFSCYFAGDGVDYWDFDFHATANDDNYFRSMDENEINTLRDNCKKILESTSSLMGGS